MNRRRFTSLMAATVVSAGVRGFRQESSSRQSSKFEPTWDSLEKHAVPEWFRDAKFGIFIHWGLYSVPA